MEVFRERVSFLAAVFLRKDETDERRFTLVLLCIAFRMRVMSLSTEERTEERDVVGEFSQNANRRGVI